MAVTCEEKLRRAEALYVKLATLKEADAFFFADTLLTRRDTPMRRRQLAEAREKLRDAEETTRRIFFAVINGDIEP